MNKLLLGEKVAAISALLLLGCTFLDWFGIRVTGQGRSISLGAAGGNAWAALDVVPVVLALAVAIALINVAIRMSRSPDHVQPQFLNFAVGLFGIVATALVLYRLVDPPTLVHSTAISVDATPEVGIFLALVAAAGIAIGAALAIKEEGAAVAGSGRVDSRG